MVNRERFDDFRLRFGIGSDSSTFTRFRTRVVQGARESLTELLESERVALEQQFAFQNGSEYVHPTSWGAGGHIGHGMVDELEEAESFAQLIERVQHVLWAFEKLDYFEHRRRYSDREYAGIVFATRLAKAIEFSPGIDLRVHVGPGKVELMPAGLPLLDEAVTRSLQWLASFPDVQKEFRQALIILSENKEDQFRQAQDSLRFGLEKLLKILLTNSDRLEDQGRPLKAWLTARGLHDNVRDVAVQIMTLLTKQYQNAAVKHDNTVGAGTVKTWLSCELEYMIYQYATLFRLLSEAVAISATASTAPSDTASPGTA